MQFNQYEIIPIDFETYFDKDYTLKKIDTPLYVMDKRFQVHGACIDNVYYDTPEKVSHALSQIDWTRSAVMAHNCAFDAYIVRHIYGHTPAYYIDTLSMARPLYQNIIGSSSLDAVSKHLGFKGKTSNILEKTKGKRILTEAENEEMGDYCVQDVEEMCKIYEVMLKQTPEFEMDLIDTTIRMFVEPQFQADVPRIKKEITRIKDEKERMFRRVSRLLPETEEETVKVLRSSNKFAEALVHNGAVSPTKISPTTGKVTHAFARTDLKFKALGEHKNPDIRLLYEARLVAKQDNALNKAEKLLAYSSLPEGIPALLNYSGAQTLRWSGKEIQLQNMGRGGEMRRSLIAPKGHVVVVVDSGQIEARVTAWLAGQENVLDVFRKKSEATELLATNLNCSKALSSIILNNFVENGIEFNDSCKKYKLTRTLTQDTIDDVLYLNSQSDIYKVMAANIYEKPVTEINKSERFLGKCAVLGLGFGMSANKFQLILKQGALGPSVDLPIEDCQNVVSKFRSTNDRISSLWNMMGQYLEAMCANSHTRLPDSGYSYKGMIFKQNEVVTHYGAKLRYPDLRIEPPAPGEEWKTDITYQSGKARKKIYGALFVENLVQHIARNIISEQTLKLARKYPPALLVHDEYVTIVPEGEADKAFEYAIECFMTAPDWCPQIPLAADGGYAKEYSK